MSRFALVLCLLAGLAAPAAAEPPSEGPAATDVAAPAPAPVAERAEKLASHDARFVRQHAVRTMGAQRQAFSRLGLFAEGRGLTIGGHGTLFDVAGGATVKLDERLRLNGGYRVIGYDYQLTGLNAIDADPNGGPFFAVAVSF